MALIGYPPFANLTNAEASQKKSTWSESNNNEEEGADSVIGAQLSRADLRYVSAGRAFLANADLTGADLTGANLIGGDLRRANLPGADLSGASLTMTNLAGAVLIRGNLSHANLAGADLSRAYLYGANLTGAILIFSNLTYADFRLFPGIDASAKVDPEVLKSAREDTWKKALYECHIIAALSVPLDNNVKLFAEMHGKEHPLKPFEQRPDPCPSPK